MFCSECGKQIEDASVFCTYCGTKTGYTEQVYNGAHNAAQYSTFTPAPFTPSPFTQTPFAPAPQKNKFIALRVLSVIGILWYSLMLAIPLLFISNDLTGFDEHYVVLGLFLSLYALVYGIVVLTRSLKCDMGVVQKMAIIDIAGAFLVFFQNCKNLGALDWTAGLGLPFFSLGLFAIAFTIITFKKTFNGVPSDSVIKKPPKAFVYTVAGVGALFFLLLLNASGSSSSSSVTVLPKNDANIIEIRFDTLTNEIRTNSVRAEQAYKYKTLRTTGYVSSIDTDLSVYVTVAAYDVRSIWVYFNESERAKILNLNKGQLITFRGVYNNGQIVRAVLE